MLDIIIFFPRPIENLYIPLLKVLSEYFLLINESLICEYLVIGPAISLGKNNIYKQ